MNVFKASLRMIPQILKFSVFSFIFIFLTSCSNDDDDTFANVRVNGSLITTTQADFVIGDRSDFNGDIDASFTGNGGSATRVFSWNNNLTTADYNADITSTSEGSFRIIVEDSEATVVLDRTIQGGAGPDSIDGVTSAGVSGIWTVTIIVTNFNGDGSFSLSEGD
ncbi:hypothetical protein AB1A65_13465 [Muricauda sp. ANG21]|uniref:hypothetical protein n=1 Tax=Allomuricauda sp. ANG21 TaxID=3042468 RepID=UPI00345344A0